MSDQESNPETSTKTSHTSQEETVKTNFTDRTSIFSKSTHNKSPSNSEKIKNVIQNSRKSNLVSIYGILISAFTFVISLILDLFTATESASTTVFFISILLLVSTGETSGFLVREERDRELNSNFEKIFNSDRCIYIGDARDGLHYLISKLKRAIRYYDTYISYGISQHHKYESIYSPLDSREYIDAFSQYIENRDHMLIGIISDDNDVHFEGIKNSIESSGREFDGFIKFGKLKKEFPIINFAILEYQNRYSDREVIFGWGHHSKERVACVFSSKDPKIVDLFMNFFECITDDDLCQWVWDNRNGDLTKTKDEKPI